jgi:hypothetical protein
MGRQVLFSARLVFRRIMKDSVLSQFGHALFSCRLPLPYVALLAWTSSWLLPPSNGIPVAKPRQLCCFCRAIKPKRRLNRRVSLGIVLVRHFGGLKQGLLLLLLCECRLFLLESLGSVSTGFLVAAGFLTHCLGVPKSVIPET